MDKIPEEQYKKAVGQLRLQLNGVMQVFMCHGLNVYVDGAIDEIVNLTEQFSMRTRGKDIPIKLKSTHWRRPTE